MTIPHKFLSDQAYQTAKAHGFHARKSPDVLYVTLIISEIYEALDADRKSRYCSERSVRINIPELGNLPDAEYSEWYRKICAGTFEDELADVVIRLYDYAAHIGLSLSEYECPEQFYITAAVAKSNSYPEFAFALTQSIVNLFSQEVEWAVPAIINTLYMYADAHSLDLYRHVLLKMRYNTLRPYRHGGVRY
jgi:hypothetical protein